MRMFFPEEEVVAAMVDLGVEISSNCSRKPRFMQESDPPVFLIHLPLLGPRPFRECFSGRVKTLHPMIAGGILFERGNAEHEKQAKELGIQPIDLVVVNLY